MFPGSSDLPKDSLQIRQDDQFYCRLLSKESSVANPSFRVYYGVASGAVPFLWESEPGTPKHIMISTTALPPLTPPPSYYSSPRNNTSKKLSKSHFMHSILPKLSLRSKVHMSPSSSTSSTSSSLSSSSSSASGRSSHCRRSSSPLSYFSSAGDHEESDDGSPTSTLCFRMRRKASGVLGGSHDAVPMKNALLSIVEHGSGRRTAA